jgi:hypothetical protein
MRVGGQQIEFLGPNKDDGPLTEEILALVIPADSLFLTRLAIQRTYPFIADDDWPDHTFTLGDVAAVGVWFSGIGERNSSEQEQAVSYALSLSAAATGKGRARRRHALTDAENDLVERLFARASVEWRLIEQTLGRRGPFTAVELERVQQKLFGTSLRRHRLSALAA